MLTATGGGREVVAALVLGAPAGVWTIRYSGSTHLALVCTSKGLWIVSRVPGLAGGWQDTASPPNAQQIAALGALWSG